MYSLNLLFIIFLNIVFYPLIFLVVIISSLWGRGGLKDFFLQLISKLGWLRDTSLESSTSNDREYIWMHVSSAGEWNTAKIFAKHLIQKTGCLLLITYFNADAKEVIHQEILSGNYLNKKCRARFLPLENTWAYYKLHKQYCTRALVIVETETWPLLLLLTRWFNKPIFLVNATLFDQETKRLKWIKWFLKGVINSFTKIYAVSEQARKNFIVIGVKPEKLSVTPNFKYDLLERMPDFSEKSVSNKLQILNRYITAQKHRSRKIVVLGSVHLRELKLIIRAIKALFADQQVCFVIAPRNLNNIDKIQALLDKNSISYTLRTSLSVAEDGIWSNSHLLLNTFGELLFFYYHADLVVMGGTFIPVGGHNFLEALYYEKKVILGIYFYHFTDFVIDFRAELEITDINNLYDKITKLLLNSDNIMNGEVNVKLVKFYGSSAKIADNISRNI